MSKGIIYLDHAAATPLDERVLKVMTPYFSDYFFNPSSPYSPAVQARRDYEAAKQSIAKVIGGRPGEIIITAGATESINLAFNSVNGHVIVPAIEHHAVLESARNHDNTIVSVGKKGIVGVDDIAKAIQPHTELVSVALANNELGTIQPLREIAEAIRKIKENRLLTGNKTPLYFHSDASQGVGQLDISVARLGVDMLTLNSGKIYGPKGVGLLWAASHVNLKPLIYGGGQESGVRSGTENVAGAIGFAKALELAAAGRKNEVRRLGELRDALEKALTEAFPDAVLSGSQNNRLSGHLHIAFPGIDGERMIFLLEARGVMVATGSACAANQGTRSHVLTAIGLDTELADGSVRITLGHLSNEENIKQAAGILLDVIAKEYSRVGR